MRKGNGTGDIYSEWKNTWWAVIGKMLENYSAQSVGSFLLLYHPLHFGSQACPFLLSILPTPPFKKIVLYALRTHGFNFLKVNFLGQVYVKIIYKGPGSKCFRSLLLNRFFCCCCYLSFCFYNSLLMWKPLLAPGPYKNRSQASFYKLLTPALDWDRLSSLTNQLEHLKNSPKTAILCPT